MTLRPGVSLEQCRVLIHTPKEDIKAGFGQNGNVPPKNNPNLIDIAQGTYNFVTRELSHQHPPHTSGKRAVMQLEDVLDSSLGDEPSSDLSNAGPLSARILALTNDRDIAHAAIGNVFWSAYIFSPASPFAARHESVKYLLDADELQRVPSDAPDIYVAFHARKSGHRPRCSLFVMDPHTRNPIVLDVRVSDAQLVMGWRNFYRWAGLQRHLADRGVLGEIAREGNALAVEANRLENFRVLVVPAKTLTNETPPALVSTARVPSSSVLTENDQNGTVGVIADNASGVTGVTLAAHTVLSNASSVKIGASQGTIVGRDPLTDSCFVDVDVSGIAAGVASPLPASRLSPAMKVNFDGCVSGPISTHVVAWSQELPYRIPLVQSRVMTNAVTNPGDSGAALLTGSNEVVGFSLARSGYGEATEYSFWIWAESVFFAHKLS